MHARGDNLRTQRPLRNIDGVEGGQREFENESMEISLEY